MMYLLRFRRHLWSQLQRKPLNAHRWASATHPIITHFCLCERALAQRMKEQNSDKGTRHERKGSAQLLSSTIALHQVNPSVGVGAQASWKRGVVRQLMTPRRRVAPDPCQRVLP